MAPFLEQVLCLQSFRLLGEGHRFFLSLLGLDCFQLEIIRMPKRYFGVASFAPIQYSPYVFPSRPLVTLYPGSQTVG